MSGVAQACIVTGLLLVAAAVVAVKARRATRTSVRYMRPKGQEIAHAITKAELASELIELQALADCGRWPVAELVRDDGAKRCVACERAVERLEHRHR